MWGLRFVTRLVGVGARLALPLFLLLLAFHALARAQEGGNQAGLVVVHEDGRVVTRCVRFDEAQISGLTLLQRSGILFSASTGPMGSTICSLNGEGCPTSDCWCECKGTPCAYWIYFQRNPDGSWGYANIGAAMRQLTDGDVDGWMWGDTTSLPPVVSFEDICGAADQQSPPAASPTAVPPTATVPAETLPTEVLATPTVEVPTATVPLRRRPAHPLRHWPPTQRGPRSRCRPPQLSRQRLPRRRLLRPRSPRLPRRVSQLRGRMMHLLRQKPQLSNRASHPGTSPLSPYWGLWGASRCSCATGERGWGDGCSGAGQSQGKHSALGDLWPHVAHRDRGLSLPLLSSPVGVLQWIGPHG